MPLYPLDFCTVVERLARARLAAALSRQEPHLAQGDFTAEQFRDAARAYRHRAEQTAVPHEQQEYRELARRFADDGDNAQARDEARSRS
jgi:hypothetical protein